MPYEITASRKRPQGFEELAGQSFVSATLEASLASGRIAHAYLFSGPRGCGKTSTARILAKALNCEKGPTAKPCGECSSCKSIGAGSSLDVIEIDGASNTSVDNVRQIKDEVLFPPNSGRYKVYIIDEVHMLSMSAFNALLKTIEEPPPYVVFIFATTELHKVPATIKSRCQQFAFRLVPIEILKGLLSTAAKEMEVEAEDEALLWIAKESGGSPRDAYTLFDQVVAFSEGRITVGKIRDKLGLVGLDAMNGLFESLVCPDPAAVELTAKLGLEALDAILQRGVSPEQLLLDAVEYSRALLLLKNGIDRESLLGASPASFSPRVLEALSSEQIERALGELLDLHRSIRFSVDPRFELELAVARLARLPSYISQAELSRTIAGLKRRALAGPGGQAQAQNSPALGQAGQVSRMPPSPEEKKKPELPTSLKSAFSSLAAIVGGEASAGDGADAPERVVAYGPGPGAKSQGQAAARAPSPGPSKADEMWAEHPEPLPPPASPPPAQAAPTTMSIPIPPPQADSGEGEYDEDGEGDESYGIDYSRPTAAGSASLGPSAGAPGPGPAREGEDVKKAVLEALGRSSPLLSSGLTTSLPWKLEEGRLVIPFRNGMEESVVKAELGSLSQTVAKVLGRSLKVELRVDRQEIQAVSSGISPEGLEDAATIVARVFRGQRMQEKSAGGSDGL